MKKMVLIAILAITGCGEQQYRSPEQVQRDREGVQQMQSVLGDSVERSCVSRGGNPIRQSNGHVICQQRQPQTTDCYSTGMGRATCTTR